VEEEMVQGADRPEEKLQGAKGGINEVGSI